ncbi:MAG: hypothetical protein LBM01_00420 [Christensenellaceae bacterium]|jgi:hypothetical protein|nr:hypothetical protein [Christensenellaceae bacterium]
MEDEELFEEYKGVKIPKSLSEAKKASYIRQINAAVATGIPFLRDPMLDSIRKEIASVSDTEQFLDNNISKAKADYQVEQKRSAERIAAIEQAYAEMMRQP